MGLCNFNTSSNFIGIYINFVRTYINYVWTLRILLFISSYFLIVAVYNKPVNSMSISCLVINSLSLESISYVVMCF